MASTSHNPGLLLKRILSLKEHSTLCLCLDSIAQTAEFLIDEFIYNLRATTSNDTLEITYISFETLNKPAYATNFIDVNITGLQNVAKQLEDNRPQRRRLVIVDSLNHIAAPHLTQFITSIASQHSTLLAVYHKDIPEQATLPHTHLQGYNYVENYPSAKTLLQFVATTILDIEPIHNDNNGSSNNDTGYPRGGIDEETLLFNLDKLSIPRGLNTPKFIVKFINRRRSGRSVHYVLEVDTEKHDYIPVIKGGKDDSEANGEGTQGRETPEMLQHLTTFKLGTTARQKEAKDQVALPFLEAQSFNVGGAIVYEYEKDDAYDEEDPYEDPF